MLGCREPATTPTREGALAGPAASEAVRRPGAEPPPGRRFAELLRRPRPDPDDAGPGPSGGPSLADPTRAARLWSARTPESRPSAAPPAPTVEASATALTDVRAAAGADGAALRFTIDDGFLAGAHMAFLLRGDALELVIEAPDGRTLDRLRAREDELREALAARGLELERFEAEGDGRNDAEAGAEEPTGTSAERRTRPRRGAKGEGAG